MKNMVSKKFVSLLSIVVLGTLIGYTGIYAWTGLTASPGDNLTSAKWNELVSKVSGVFTDSNGNVGIGTTTPSAKLHIASNSAYLWLQDLDATNGVGGMTSSLKLRDSTGAGAGLIGFDGSSDQIFKVHSYVGQNIQIGSNPSYNTLTLTSSGNVGIGTTTPSQKLHVNGTALATAWNTTSDVRKKENITKLENSLEKICAIRGVNFDWKDSKKHDVGVIAQEVEKVFPEFVTTDSSGFKSVDYGKLTAPMIEAIKELKAENDAKSTKIEILEKQNEAILKRLEKLEK